MKSLLKRLAVFVLVIGLMIPSMAVYAKADENTKTIQVPINKNYKTAKFTLTFDYYDNYSVIVKSPEGKEYKGTLESDRIVQCVVDDVTVGQWEVVISRETPSEDESEEEPLPEMLEAEQRAISPVKVKVEGSMENLVDVSKDITVATDIAGLKMYFKDDSFVAEWTDTTCGNVNIEVANAKNLQKIDSQTVKGNSYTCPLESSVEEIMVTVVPAVSSSVDGASNTYTYKFENNPDAVVTYEDLDITNHDSIVITCELNESYGVKILVNGKQVESTDLLKKGTYTFEAPIDVGTNDIVTYIVDEKGNMRSTSYSVDKDVIAPGLELISTYEDIVTEDEFITIEGAVDDFDKLMINNAEIEVEGDNTFKYDYKLKEGLNQIAVVASDIAGNETVYDIAVTRVIPEEKPVPWIKIIICAALVGLVLIYALEVVKKKRNPEEYSKQSKAEDDEDDEYSEYDNVDISQLSQKEKKSILKGPHIVWDILSFAVPLIAAYIILSYVIMVSVVQSGSMEPKLPVGNTVFYNRLAYVSAEPQRGDVVVFFSKEYGSYYGKRIIGVPGDVIQFKDGYVVINNQYCDETAYIPSEIETNCSKEFEVPEGCYFMLGDNRELSNDSRYWNNPYIPKECIKGKYMGQIDFSFQFDILYKFTGNDKASPDEISTVVSEESVQDETVQIVE